MNSIMYLRMIFHIQEPVSYYQDNTIALRTLNCLNILQQTTKLYKIIYISTTQLLQKTCSIKHTFGLSTKVIIKWSQFKNIYLNSVRHSYGTTSGGILRKRDNFEDPGIDGRTVLLVIQQGGGGGGYREDRDKQWTLVNMV